jgi:hypothetical protein
MSRVEDRNPCLYCGCYDEDMGCTMPSVDRSYACPLNDEDKDGGSENGKQ